MAGRTPGRDHPFAGAAADRGRGRRLDPAAFLTGIAERTGAEAGVTHAVPFEMLSV